MDAGGRELKALSELILKARDRFSTCGTDAETRAMRWLAREVTRQTLDYVCVRSDGTSPVTHAEVLSELDPGQVLEEHQP
jgi:hypothetical protein